MGYDVTEVRYDVTRCAVVHGKVQCQCAQTAVAGEAKRRLFLEDLAMKMNANVRLHVLGTVFQHLRSKHVRSIVTGLV